METISPMIFICGLLTCQFFITVRGLDGCTNRTGKRRVRYSFRQLCAFTKLSEIALAEIVLQPSSQTSTHVFI